VEYGDVDVDEMDETGYTTLPDSTYGSPPYPYGSLPSGTHAPTSIYGFTGLALYQDPASSQH
jgi:hypothetical protein